MYTKICLRHTLGTFFCGHSLALTSTGPGWSMVFVVLCPGAPEGSTGSYRVLVIKHLTRSGHRLKSNPTDGVQHLGTFCFFCGSVTWLYNQYWPGGFMGL